MDFAIMLKTEYLNTIYIYIIIYICITDMNYLLVLTTVYIIIIKNNNNLFLIIK